MNNRSPRGFTLVELLTVIAVVAILAAITFSGYGRVKGKANTAKCNANLHQLGVAVALYMAGHGNKFPDGGWLEGGAKWQRQLWEYTGHEDVFTCPDGAHDMNTWGGKFPNSDADIPFDYGYNSHLNSHIAGPSSVLSVSDPTRLPVIHELVSQHLFAGWVFGIDESQSHPDGHRQAFAARHQGRGHVLWADGHVSSLTYQEYMDMAKEYGNGNRFCRGETRE